MAAVTDAMGSLADRFWHATFGKMLTIESRKSCKAYLFLSSRFCRTTVLEAPVASSTLLKVLLKPAWPNAYMQRQITVQQ